MTRTTSRCIPFLAAALALALMPAASSARTMDAGEAVLAAQDARIAATIRGDVAALGAMMTDDLTYTHSSGVTETKAEFLDALRSGKHVYKVIDAPGRRVRVHGDSAVVSGPCHVVVEPGGRRTEIDLYFSELYVKQGGAWRWALWHSTRLPAGPPASAAPPPPTSPRP